MQKLTCDRTLTNRGGYSLNGPAADIASREDSGHACFKQAGWALELPAVRLAALLASEDEPFVVARHAILEPLCVRLGPDHHEQRRSGHDFSAAILAVAQCQGFQAVTAGAVDDFCGQADDNVAGLTDLGNEILRHAATQAGAAHNHGHRGGVLG